MTIEIIGLTPAQQVALEDMLKTWVYLGSVGSSRWTAFFADGDGNFHPKITVDGHEPRWTELFPRNHFWKNDEYRIDFDAIAWKLREI